MTQGKKITKTQEMVYELKVKDVMTTDIVTVSPMNTMNELREILHDRRISGTPVVEGKQLVGIIGVDDLIKCLSQGEMDATVGGKMTRKVEILYADEPLAHAVSKFDQYGFGRFPVIECNHERIIGILTGGDIAKGLLKSIEIAYHTEEFRHNKGTNHISNNTAMAQSSFNFQYRVVGQAFNTAGEYVHKVKKMLLQLGFHHQIVRRLTVAAYEAEMNIVIYSYGGYISVSADQEHIILEARDTGPGIPDTEQAMKRGFSTAPTWVQELGFGAGMGLPNIKKCADTMDLTSQVGKGTNLKIVIKTTNSHEKQ